MKFRGIIPTLAEIPEEDIAAVIKAYRSAVDTKATDEKLRSYAVNSLIGMPRDEVIQKINKAPALLRDLTER